MMNSNENSEDQTRRKIIEMQFLRMGRKADEMDLSVAMEDLSEIPIERIEWCCQQARKKNENVSPPTNNKILKQFNHISSGQSDSWENTVKQAMERRIANREAIAKQPFIEVAHPEDEHSRKISSEKFINEAYQYLNGQQ
ncbi:MAG: hypothetical protein GY861_14560 [bacterium]|nr:hypothetical protein [bacterium]